MLGYTGSPIDRAEALRRDSAWVDAARSDPGSRYLVLDNLKPAMDVSGPAPVIGWVSAADAPAPENSVLLGLLDGLPHFACAGPVPPGLQAIDARTAATICPAADAAIIAHARSLVDWHQRHRFCANCGTLTEPERGGQQRRCPSCGAEHYPRTDPVAIMIVIDRASDRALLGHSPRMPAGMFSALAGFVEVGESLEEAVRREVAEEAGVRIGAVHYVASQPWPFPSSLMLGCLADAVTTELRIDSQEIAEARWVTREECRASLAGSGGFSLPPPLAIAHYLLLAWLEGE